MSSTTNYGFPKYEPNDAPNLCGSYNQAMDMIDQQLHGVSTGTDGASAYIASAREAATTPVSVEKLAESLFVDPSTGLVFYKQ